ncbi:MAG: GGDEF domain-containing protein [Acidobacteriota bacterium]
MTCRRCAELEAEVKRLSTDAVTGLAGRAVFNHVLEIEFSRATRTGAALGVLMLDLDHFKAVNDTYGHLEGDKVLGRVAQVIRASLRGSDTAARYGGEEFVVLVGATSPDGLRVLAERIRRRVELMGRVKEDAPYTVSIGCAWIQPDDKSGWQAVKRADGALYCAKETGRNKVCMADGAG